MGICNPKRVECCKIEQRKFLSMEIRLNLFYNIANIRSNLKRFGNRAGDAAVPGVDKPLDVQDTNLKKSP
jgi:hypothetical protein